MDRGQKKICDALKMLDLPALREIDAYLHALTEKRAACESPHNPNQEVIETKRRSWGVLRLEKVRCSKEGCKKCTRGKLHGPYWYLYAKHKGHTVSQ